jgi:hypothetical protein
MQSTINPLTLRSIFLKPFFNEQPASEGATGFLASCYGKAYLITARHVVTGRNNDDGIPLDKKTLCLPNSLSVRVPRRSSGMLVFHDLKIVLYDDGNPDQGTPQWLEHPILRKDVDVVAIRIDGQSIEPDMVTPLKVAPISGISFGVSEGAMLAPTTPVRVIGYPFAKFGPAETAIWTTCHVASEYGARTDPFYLIDGRTREGQSGSPVNFYSASGDIGLFGGTISSPGPISFFAGLYSGRINKEADIGKVWKASVIREILEHHSKP